MTEQQKDFVHMYLKHRDKIIAHNIVYGDTGNYDAAESAANRLLRIPEIADTIRSIQDNIRHEVEEEFKAKYREELMTIYEKRLLLKKIATGELYVEQKYKGKNCTQCSQYISPTINQMLAALKEDSKLAGHHPFKQNGKWVIPALQTEQEQEEIISTLEKDLSEPCNGAENKTGQIEVLSPAVVSHPPVGGGGGFEEAGGGLLAQDTRENDPSDRVIRAGNKRQHPDSPECFREETTNEYQEISPLKGDLGVDSHSSNPPENDNNLAERLNEANENDPSDRVIPARTIVQSGRRAGNNGQHPEETNTDNQLLTDELENTSSLPCPSQPSVGSGGVGGTHDNIPIISQEKLRELLYPQKPKLSYMKNKP